MSNILFPNLPGLTWEVKLTATPDRGPDRGQRLQCARAVVRGPAVGVTCAFEFLRDDALHDEFNLLEGFFLACRGQFDSFLLDLGMLTKNPDDSALQDSTASC